MAQKSKSIDQDGLSLLQGGRALDGQLQDGRGLLGLLKLGPVLDPLWVLAQGDEAVW